MNCDLLVKAKWIITSEDSHPILEDYALIIKDHKILAILPQQQAKEYTASQILDYSSHALLPGFINAHTHLAMNWFRGLADDLSLMNWLQNYIWPAEAKWVSEEFVKDASLFAMAEMIRCGTICFNDMYFFPQATAQAVETAGIRGSIGMTIINIATRFANDTEDYFTKGLAFLEQYKNHERIAVTVAPHAIYTVDDASLLRVKKIADEHQLRISMHLQETADEIQQSLKQTGIRPLRRLQKLGFLSPQLIAIHMAQLNEEDLAIIAVEKPHIVHCPESNMKLASGACPVKKLMALGLNVALGTDGAASNNDLDMLGEMRSAALLGKLTSLDPEAVSAYEAIKMATIHGAKALGIDAHTGSLLAGKSADFIAINLDAIETQPLYHPASAIVYAASRHQVTDVWVAGKQLLKNGQLLTLDEHALKEKAVFWRDKISS